MGAIWEGVVFSEIRRQVQASDSNRSFWYYRDNTGLEVDFLVLGEGARLIECKWTALPDTSAARGIRKLSDLAASSGPELAGIRGAIICRTPHPFPLPLSDPPTIVCGLAEIPPLLDSME